MFIPIVPLLMTRPPELSVRPAAPGIAPEIIRVSPVAICRPRTLPTALRVTVLVPFKMQAFVEAVGVPLVQLPSRFQKLFPPFCHKVEGALRLPH